MSYYTQWPFIYSKKLNLIDDLLHKKYYYDIDNDKIIDINKLENDNGLMRTNTKYKLTGKRTNINKIFRNIKDNKIIEKPMNFHDWSYSIDSILTTYLNSNLRILPLNHQIDILKILEPESVSTLSQIALNLKLLTSSTYDAYWKYVIVTRYSIDFSKLFTADINILINIPDIESLNTILKTNYSSYYQLYKYILDNSVAPI